MASTSRPLRLGTRGSPLALAQAGLVKAALIAAHGWDEAAVEIVPIATQGDIVQDRPLAEIGGKALWTKTLDRALLDKRTDASVHSMKDVETVRPDSIAILAMLQRADVRDRMIGAASIEALPHGATFGTASPRRAAQLLRLRPDLHIVPFRGNVATRIAKVAAGEADATMLAAAGLERLGHGDVGVPVPIEVMLPAVAQGAVGVECRADDSDTCRLLASIDHTVTSACVTTERALLAALGGSCHSPVGVLAVVDGKGIRLRAELLSKDGRDRVAEEAWLERGDLSEVGRLARRLLDRAPPTIARLFECAS